MAVSTVFIFGLLGNILSTVVFLAPVPTFFQICKKKSTEGFQSIPYSVSLVGATLSLYYGILKPDGFMLVTISTIGCTAETIYLLMFLIFAPKKAKIYTVKLIVFFNTIMCGLAIILTFLFSKGQLRTTIAGWTCAIFAFCVYVSPLSIMGRVIQTKSVEYMPFTLSFCLTLNGIIWFFYGLLLHDFFIAVPNALGCLFGLAQMILYLFYKNAKQLDLLPVPEHKLQELATGEGNSSTGNDIKRHSQLNV